MKRQPKYKALTALSLSEDNRVQWQPGDIVEHPLLTDARLRKLKAIGAVEEVEPDAEPEAVSASAAPETEKGKP